MIQLPKNKVHVPPEEAIKGLAQAFKILDGSLPSKKTLALIAGQTGGETGGFYLPNYNFGGIKKHSRAPAFQMLLTRERDPNTGEIYQVELPFAAYHDATQGALDYLRVLKRRPEWWSALKAGDPVKYVQALKTRPAYMTATASSYLKMMRNHMHYPAIGKYSSNTVGGVIAVFLGLISGGVAYSQYKKRRK